MPKHFLTFCLLECVMYQVTPYTLVVQITLPAMAVFLRAVNYTLEYHLWQCKYEHGKLSILEQHQHVSDYSSSCTELCRRTGSVQRPACARPDGRSPPRPAPSAGRGRRRTPRRGTTPPGARRAGVYYVPLGTRLRPAEMGYIVRDCAASAIIATSEMEPIAAGLPMSAGPADVRE